MTTERWNIDTSHSNVEFVARHLVVTKVRGTFTKWKGTIDVDLEDLPRSSVEAVIQVASIDTREPQRDTHLKSPDFLDAEKYPEITFKSRKGEKRSADKLTVEGDLTIHGVTRPVTLHVDVLGKNKDPWGNQRLLFSASTSILRTDFGLTWNQVLETGGLLVSDKIDIEIEVQAVKAA